MGRQSEITTASLAALPEASRRVIVVTRPPTEEELNEKKAKPTVESLGILGGAAASVALGLPVLLAPIIAFKGYQLWRDSRKGMQGLTPVLLENLDSSIQFPPGHPNVGTVYGLNPVRPFTYIPLAEFHRKVLREKASELFMLLSGLRAATARVEVMRGATLRGKAGLKSIIPTEVPVIVDASTDDHQRTDTGVTWDLKFSSTGVPKIADGLRWLEHEPEWRGIAQSRLRGELQEFRVELHYSDTLGIGAKLAAELVDAGLSLGGNYESIEEEAWVVTGKFASKGFFGW